MDEVEQLLVCVKVIFFPVSYEFITFAYFSIDLIVFLLLICISQLIAVCNQGWKLQI